MDPLVSVKPGIGRGSDGGAWATSLAGKHKKHDRKQPRKGHGKLHTGIQLVRPEGGQDQAETVYVIHWQIQAPVWVDPGSVATKTSAQYGMPR